MSTSIETLIKEGLSKEDSMMERMMVKNNATSYGGRYNGRVVDVARPGGQEYSSIGCVIPGLKNNASSYGYFWFKKNELVELGHGGLIDNSMFAELTGAKTAGSVERKSYRYEVLTIARADDIQYLTVKYTDAVAATKMSDPAVVQVLVKDPTFELNLRGIELLITDETKIKLAELADEYQDALTDIEVKYEDLNAILALPDINTLKVIKEASLLLDNETGLAAPELRGAAKHYFEL